MAVSSQEVLDALTHLKLPASGQSLSESGRLSDIVVQGERVMFSIAVDATEVPAMEEVRRAAQEIVEAMPDVAQALVSLTADRPAGSTGGESAPAQAGQASADPRTGPQPRATEDARPQCGAAADSGRENMSSPWLPARAASAKSTTACNIALGLVALGLKVGVLDADIYGPSMPKLFGLSGKPKAGPDRKIIPLENYGLKVMSIGFMVDEETPMIWRGPMVMSAITQMLREVNWGELDVMIVDMPPGTGDAQTHHGPGHAASSGAVIVSTPAGSRASRCASRRGHVPAHRNPGSGDRGEHGDLYLPQLRPYRAHLRPWRGAAGGGKARRTLSRRGYPPQHGDPREFGCRASGYGGGTGEPLCDCLSWHRVGVVGQSQCRDFPKRGAGDRIRMTPGQAEQ